jgi:Cytochrome P450
VPGIPHYLTQDDEYQGYHIPKGSIVHPLEWYVILEHEIWLNINLFPGLFAVIQKNIQIL